MRKFIIVIGQSASGKTTFVRKKFVTGRKLKTYDKPLKHTVADNKIILLGHYVGDIRCEGTDQLALNALPGIIDFIKKKQSKYPIWVAEGDRINCKRFFDFIKILNVDVRVYYFTCTLEDSISRREKTGSKASESFVRTTKTKSKNMKTYCKGLGFDVITKDTGSSKEGLMKWF